MIKKTRAQPPGTKFKRFQAGTYQYIPPEVYANAAWGSDGAVSEISKDAAGDPFQVISVFVHVYFLFFSFLVTAGGRDA